MPRAFPSLAFNTSSVGISTKRAKPKQNPENLLETTPWNSLYFNRQHIALAHATSQGCFNFPSSLNPIPQGLPIPSSSSRKGLRVQIPRHKSPTCSTGMVGAQILSPYSHSAIPKSKIKSSESPKHRFIFLFFFTCLGSPRAILRDGDRCSGDKPCPFPPVPPGRIQGQGQQKAGQGDRKGSRSCSLGKTSQECRLKQPKIHPWLRQVTEGTRMQPGLISE